MKGSRLIAAIVLLSIGLVCFISTPVFPEDPWDVNYNTDLDPDAEGGGNDGIDPPPGDFDPDTDEGTDWVDNGFGPYWLTGLASGVSYEIISLILGASDQSTDPKRVVVEESSGNATAQ
jgi:hypothetical protein